MTAAELDTWTSVFTEAQSAIAKARDRVQLDTAAGLLDGPEFQGLPERVQEELLHQYAKKDIEIGR